jgi:LysR family carnitine catabolism transcriptional activator
VTPSHLLEANQMATIGRMVSVGLGVAAVPELCRGQMEDMGVLCKPIAPPNIERRVGIFTRRRHAPSQAARALINCLRLHFTSDSGGHWQ